MVAGSGRMTSERLSDEAEVAIMGPGTLETPQVDAGSLEVAIAGSENGRMQSLHAGNAEINIAGAGEAVFASDGEVEANILGSGRVSFPGRPVARSIRWCSGSLVCEREEEAAS
jgi:hypothetical protein